MLRVCICSLCVWNTRGYFLTDHTVKNLVYKNTEDTDTFGDTEDTDILEKREKKSLFLHIHNSVCSVSALAVRVRETPVVTS